MIDYNKIVKSLEFYEDKGYQRIESPWTVTKQVAQITAPPNATYFSIEEKNKVLVASGEQSYLYLYLKGFLPKGKFQTVTPCFRDEPFDDTHTKYFIKNELIVTDEVTHTKFLRMMLDAVKFFRQFHPSPQLRRHEDGSFDIEINGVEVGSYGIRECDYLKWIYGTGCAEPRLTYALSKS